MNIRGYIICLFAALLSSCADGDKKTLPARPAISNIRTYEFSEGLAVVSMTDTDGNTTYQVIRTDGSVAFGIALDSCIIGTTYQDSLLWYYDLRHRREGYLDRRGNPTTARPPVRQAYAEGNAPRLDKKQPEIHEQVTVKGKAITTSDWRKVAANHPYYKEAQKVINGQLNEQDSQNRQMILDYCEHLRTAYTTKDIDFLKQVFSNEALIIVGRVIRSTPEHQVMSQPRVTYSLVSKQDYLTRLQKVFAANKRIDLHFSNFAIKRHPTVNGIYGVTLRQGYRSDRYADDGWLFLLWDFRDTTAPVIHVRTWQEALQADQTDLPVDSVFSLRDFNLR